MPMQCHFKIDFQLLSILTAFIQRYFHVWQNFKWSLYWPRGTSMIENNKFLLASILTMQWKRGFKWWIYWKLGLSTKNILVILTNWFFHDIFRLVWVYWPLGFQWQVSGKSGIFVSLNFFGFQFSEKIFGNPVVAKGLKRFNLVNVCDS